MKIGFVFPLARNRDNYLQINHIQNLFKPGSFDVKCYAEFTNEIEQDLYVEGDESSVWELIRQARQRGQIKAYDEGCDWIIHHDFAELFFDDYLIRLDETLNSNLSLHYADFSYFTRFNKFQVIQPVFRINANYNEIENKPFLVDNKFWETKWYGPKQFNKNKRYYQVRRGSSWIWHRKILEFLNFEIKPQSAEIRRHDSNWREYLFDKGFKCVLDTKLRKIDNTDPTALDYYN